MKVNAPEKIYLSENPCRDELEDVWFNNRSSKSDIEYTRTDAFIEKACFWLELNLSDRPKEDIKFWLEDFKNYIKED